MSYKEYLKEKENDFPAPAYLFWTKDHFLLKEIEKVIREGVNQEQADFSLDTYDLDSPSDRTSPFREIIDSLNTFSFFAGKKTVIVQNTQKMKKKDLEPLTAYLESPSDTSTLFLLYNDTLASNRKGPYKGCKIISLDLSGQEQATWISEYADRLGFSISSQALDFLFVILGGDSGLLMSEITKLSLLNKRSIDVEDLAEIVTGEAGIDTFEFTRALVSGNRKKAFSIANALRNDDFNMILGAINWQISKSRAQSPPAKRLHDYGAMLEADIMNKSTSGGYPLELLITRLLGRK